MNVESLAPFLAGPGSAVILCVCVGAAVYRLVVKYGIPLVSSVVNRHMEELERANARHADGVRDHLQHIKDMGMRYERLSHTHAAEHKAILEAIEEVSARLPMAAR